MSEWIDVKIRKPEVGQLVVGWLSRHQEPACLTYEEDGFWRELVMFDPDEDREDKVSHWMPLPEKPNV
jgi:nuclear transport factor 2 (NTF2) superfamily protein